MNYLFYIFIFIFGATVGSFLNVVICRLKVTENRSREIYRERFSVTLRRFVGNCSHCVKCGQVLAWYDLLPIVSFFILRGQCRACQKPISWQYPLVEAATGILFVLIFNISPYGGSLAGRQFSIFNEFSSSNYQIINIVNLGYWFFIISSCIVIFVYDLKKYIIPDKVLFPTIIISFLWQVFLSLKIGHWSLIENWSLVIGHFGPYLLAALAAAAFFLLLVLITRGQGMGLGDVKLALLMGLVLGWPNILIALFLAFCLGALVGVSLIIVGKKTMKSQIPFGPFLIVGTLIALFWGQSMADWYWRLLMVQ